MTEIDGGRLHEMRARLTRMFDDNSFDEASGYTPTYCQDEINQQKQAIARAESEYDRKKHD